MDGDQSPCTCKGLSSGRGYGGPVLRQGVPRPSVPLELFARVPRIYVLNVLHPLSLVPPSFRFSFLLPFSLALFFFFSTELFI